MVYSKTVDHMEGGENPTPFIVEREIYVVRVWVLQPRAWVGINTREYSLQN